MHRSIQTLCAGAALVLAAACQKDSTPVKTTSSGETNMSPPADSATARGHAMVRAVNALSGTGNIGVRLADQVLFDNVKPASVTDYRELESTMSKFSAMPMGAAMGTVPATADHLLMDGNRYTVILLAEDVSKNTIKIVKDDVIPDSGMARVRVIHAAPGGPEFDVSLVGSKDKLFSGVDFKSEAGYKDVPVGMATIELRAKDATKVLLSIPRLDFRKGTQVTIVVTGAAKLAYFTFTDTMMAATPKP